MKQLSVWAVIGIWATVSLAAVFYASWQGYGGRAFAFTADTFAFLLLVMLLFAARGMAEKLASKFGAGGGFLLGAAIFLCAIAYLVGTGAFALPRAGAIAALIFLPLGLAVSAEGAAPGAWQDFFIVLGVWVFVKFGPSHWLWPYPGGKLSYVLTVLVALDVALAVFLLVRRIKGVGYSLGWGKRWGLYTGGSFAVFISIAVPLGLAMHFLSYAPRWNQWGALLFSVLGVFFFTAWPEEFLFRGLLQNFLARASRSEFAGWWTASLLFGFAHITNGGFPNWRYVILASLAGIFYGWTWRKTGSICASAMVHAAVDVAWHFLFTNSAG